MNYKPLIYSLHEIGAIKFGDFTLKSGEKSNIYIDLRLIVSYPEVLRAVSEAIWQQVGGYLFDMICGVPYTALPIATCISLNQNLPMVMRRKEKKEYGTRQIIEGVYEIGKKCLIVEDIITSGSSILETADDLEVAGLKVKEIAVLISREKQGKANLAAKHYELYAAMTLKEVLTTLFNSNKLNKDEQKIVEHLLQDHSHA